MKDFYLALALDAESRTLIQNLWPPRHKVRLSDHITIQRDVTELGMALMNADIKPRVRLLGYAYNERVDCALVLFNGEVTRPDGHFYHVTMSHIPGATPVESNAMIHATLAQRRVQITPGDIRLTGHVRLLARSKREQT